MTSRPILLVVSTVAAAVLTSCANSSPSVAVLPKTSIRSASSSASKPAAGIAERSTQNEAFTVAPPSQAVIASSANRPKDRHAMPVYAFTDRRRVVRTTAYTCSEDDHLIYGNKNAAGTTLRYTDRVRSAAADWSFYPVGTVFRINGMPHLYVVDDYGSALTGTGTIDLYKPSKAVMNQWGRRNVEVTIVQWGSFTRSAEILAQRTHHAHCNQMLANIIRQRPDLRATLAKR
jgi:3D (Asp-Asp-Asp) domain-containing protein